MGDSSVYENFQQFSDHNFLNNASTLSGSLKYIGDYVITLDSDDVEQPIANNDPNENDEPGANKIDYDIQYGEDRWEDCECGRLRSCQREFTAAKKRKIEPFDPKKEFIKKIREMKEEREFWLKTMMKKLDAEKYVPLGMPSFQ